MRHFAFELVCEFGELIDFLEPREALFFAEDFDGLFEEVLVVVEAGVSRDAAAVVLEECTQTSGFD